MNNKSKTVTIFGILVIIILVCTTAIGFFLYRQERDTRKNVEDELGETQSVSARLSEEIKSLKQEIVLLKDKNNEADQKINDYLDELDLKEGLSEQLKKDNDALKGQIDSLNTQKDKYKADLDSLNQRLNQAEKELSAQQVKYQQLEKEYQELKSKPVAVVAPVDEAKEIKKPVKVELDKMVVNPYESIKGRVLSIDKDSEFLVCNLGSKQGVKVGDIISIYRGDEYLGDTKVTKVQEQLSAADIIPPFSVRTVRKNDTAILKP